MKEKKDIHVDIVEDKWIIKYFSVLVETNKIIIENMYF